MRSGTGIIFNTRVVECRAISTVVINIESRVLFLIPELLGGVLKLEFKFASGAGIIFNTRVAKERAKAAMQMCVGHGYYF